MSDTPSGETADASKNDAQPTVSTNTVDNAEVERLRKEAEQAKMRANQLQNELDKKKAEEEATKTKQLEEQNEWRAVAEQERVKREALETERETEKRQAELKTTTQEIFKGFPQEVVEIAETTGLSLQDTDETTQALFKEKLEAIKAKVASSESNNPTNPAPPSGTSREILIERVRGGDKNARQEMINNIPAVQEMKRQAGIEA